MAEIEIKYVWKEVYQNVTSLWMVGLQVTCIFFFLHFL